MVDVFMLGVSRCLVQSLVFLCAGSMVDVFMRGLYSSIQVYNDVRFPRAR